MAGINHSEYWEHIVLFSKVIYRKLIAIPEHSDIFIRKAHNLCFFQNIKVVCIFFELILHFNDSLERFKEVWGDFCDIVNSFNSFSAS